MKAFNPLTADRRSLAVSDKGFFSLSVHNKEERTDLLTGKP